MVLDSTADTTSELLKSYQALKAQHTALQADVKVRFFGQVFGALCLRSLPSRVMEEVGATFKCGTGDVHILNSICH